MMTDFLYLKDSYLKECSSRVIERKEKKVILDRSVFYPGGGGQPSDTGFLEWDGGRCRVTGMEGEYHVVDGDVESRHVRCIIDWDRRYSLMRTHTATHVISGVAYHDFGAVITGSRLYELSARVDLSVQMDKRIAEEIIERSNKVAARGMDVGIKFIDREELKSRPELMRVSPRLYEKYEVIRVVEIGNFDAQADGGTHVKNTKEIGRMVLKKYESKGKRNRRIYVEIID